MPGKKRVPHDDDLGRPSTRDAVARARAAAGPAVAKATAAAGPAAVKAGAKAGSLFGTLRLRAKETAKGFADGYKNPDDDSPATTQAADDRAGRPRPGPAPKKD